jgi:hypothetical protein
VTRAREAVRFLDEWQWATGREPGAPFAASQLPDPSPDWSTVTLPRATLVRFRNDYSLLLGFAARLAQIDERMLAPIHLLRELLTPDDPDDSPTSR